MSNDFVLRRAATAEFDYPAGEGDAAAYSTYDGRGGVSVASFARRLLYAVRFGSLNILLSNDLTDRTRILYYRNVRERAARALPFLALDRDPYMVITGDGKLVWMLDGYTVSSRYPYARSVSDGVNYMRNSVKVTIDAYGGEVRAYLAAPNDPIVRTLARIYPGLLQPLDSMPADLRAHMRYPEDSFRCRPRCSRRITCEPGDVLSPRGPVADPNPWPAVPHERVANRSSAEAFLRHMVMRLPGEREPEFILMRPSRRGRRTTSRRGWWRGTTARTTAKLEVYRFPRQSLVFGPNQIVNASTRIRRWRADHALGSARLGVVRGELLVCPIGGR
jgi:uncharacterized membrane protein (UPF0182 family)